MRNIRAPAETGPNDLPVTAPAMSPMINPEFPTTGEAFRSNPPAESSTIPHSLLQATTLATAQEVRRALAQIVEALGAHGVAPEDSAKVEVVLAEVMNNIAEHAFADETPGTLSLRIERLSAHLSIRVEDDGGPMPNLAPPPGIPHDLSVDLPDLPEGGFGWFLIRELTDSLHYQHNEGRNCLTFTMKLSSDS